MKKSILAFWTRVKANKITSGLGAVFIGSLLALGFPSLTSWLPKPIQDQIMQIAFYTIGAAISSLFLFVKQHGNTGDPAGLSSPIVPQQPTPIVNQTQNK